MQKGGGRNQEPEHQEIFAWMSKLPHLVRQWNARRLRPSPVDLVGRLSTMQRGTIILRVIYKELSP